MLTSIFATSEKRMLCSRFKCKAASAARNCGALLGQAHSLDAVACGVAGVKWFHHGTLLAMDAARTRGSNPESCFDPFRFKLQQTGGCDRGANAAKDRSAVETAVLNIGRVSGDFGDDLDGEHVSLQ